MIESGCYRCYKWFVLWSQSAQRYEIICESRNFSPAEASLSFVIDSVSTMTLTENPFGWSITASGDEEVKKSGLQIRRVQLFQALPNLV